MKEAEADEIVHCLEKCEKTTNLNNSSSSRMMRFFFSSQPHRYHHHHHPYAFRLAKILVIIASILGITLMVIRFKASFLPSSSVIVDITGIEEEESSSSVPSSRPTLYFRRNKLNCSQEDDDSQDYDASSSSCHSFKIVQIADIHLGEAEDLDWGPEQDRKTFKVLDAVLLREQPIDLIILSGDQLTGNNCKENATAYYQMLGEFLSKYNTPWATIFGNHDDLGFVDPKTGKQSPEAKYNRRDLMKIDRSFPLSLSQAGPIDVFGTSNYVLDIMRPVDDDIDAEMTDTDNHHHPPSPAAQVFLFDSGGGSLPEVIDETHLKWLSEQENRLIDRSNIPAVAFQHIPTLSHKYSSQNEMKCTGMNGDNGMAPLESDAGIVSALVQAKRFLFLAVGHNHGNDYCCPYYDPPATATANTTTTTTTTTAVQEEESTRQAFYLCFGRHSGYGGYGKWERGARVYELKQQRRRRRQGETTKDEMSWKSWVRLESGEIVDSV